MALDTTSYAYALKTLYPDKRVETMAYKDNPFYAFVPKNQKFFGENRVVPVIYGDPQGRSAVFATAQANKDNHRGVKFTITRASDYSLASITSEVIEASANDSGALMQASKTEMDGAFNSIIRSCAIALYGSGTGVIGQISSAAIAGSTVVLAQPDDITNFEVGQKLQLSATDGGGALRSAGATMTVATVDRSAGTFTTVAGVVASIAAAAPLDYIIQQGDYDAKLKGLAAWLPSAAPGATPFFGVARNVDTTRLGGVRYDGSGVPVDEALIEGAYRVGREGGTPSHCFLNYAQFANLQKALGSKVEYTDLSVGEIGFRGIVVHGPKKPIQVFADQNCPKGVAYLLQLDSWTLHSLGQVPKILNLDGLDMLREASSDGYEFRIGYRAQLACNAPGFNARITLAT